MIRRGTQPKFFFCKEEAEVTEKTACEGNHVFCPSGFSARTGTPVEGRGKKHGRETVLFDSFGATYCAEYD